MTDEMRQKLTEWVGLNWWPKTSGINMYSQIVEVDSNRTFTTWQDFGDLKNKLVEKGLWNMFNHYMEGVWRLSPIDFDKDDHDGDGRSSLNNFLINTDRIEDMYRFLIEIGEVDG